MTALLATNKIQANQSALTNSQLIHDCATRYKQNTGSPVSTHQQSAHTWLRYSLQTKYRLTSQLSPTVSSYMTALLTTNKIQAHQSAHTWLCYSLQTKYRLISQHSPPVSSYMNVLLALNKIQAHQSALTDSQLIHDCATRYIGLLTTTAKIQASNQSAHDMTVLLATNNYITGFTSQRLTTVLITYDCNQHTRPTNKITSEAHQSALHATYSHAQCWHDCAGHRQIVTDTGSEVSSYMCARLTTSSTVLSDRFMCFPVSTHQLSAHTWLRYSLQTKYRLTPVSSYMTVLLATNKIQAHQSAHTWLRYSLQTKYRLTNSQLIHTVLLATINYITHFYPISLSSDWPYRLTLTIPHVACSQTHILRPTI